MKTTLQLPKYLIVFLDVDGVLNVESDSDPFFLDPEKLDRVLHLLDAAGPNARIVISSSWARHPQGLFALANYLKGAGLSSRVIGFTPQDSADFFSRAFLRYPKMSEHYQARAFEIASWIYTFGEGIAGFVILDDLDLAATLGSPQEGDPYRHAIPGGLYRYFVKCDPREGLTSDVLARALTVIQTEWDYAKFRATFPKSM